MNPISFIPGAYQVYARIAAFIIVTFACVSAGWMLRGWKDGTELADQKVKYETAIADAAGRSQAAQKKFDAEHAQLTTDLAASSGAHHEDLTRAEHANDLLRADVAAGTRVVRIAASCPDRSGDVPQAAAGGRVDPGAGVVLSAPAGQAVLDLRANIIASEHQLAACQDQVRKITGQAAPAPKDPPPS